MRLLENRELREERGRLATQMQELAAGGMKTSEDREKFNRLDAEQKRLKDRIDLIERADVAYSEMRRSGAPPAGGLGEVISPTEHADIEYRAAFGRYLRRGRSELSMEDRAMLKMETRDLSEGALGGAYPGAPIGAGFFVPVGFVQKVEVALKYYGPMLDGGLGMPTILDTTTGQPLPWPTSNDTLVMGELVSENQPATVQDVNVGMIMFGAWKLSTKLVKVSLELIEDSAFDIEDFLINQFGERIGRAANSYLTTGLGFGQSQPYGIVPAALAGGLIATAAGSYSNDGVGGANTIGSDDLVTLEHKVDPLYRREARYMMSDQVLKSLKMIKDRYGRPLWQPGIRDREPDTINGYSYCINPYMDQLQTQASSPAVTATTMLFGQLGKYVVRRVRNLSVLRLSERFAEYGQVGFLGFYRFDGQLVDAGTHPIAALQNVF
jgi:HK97 family phage major capsid protein